MPAVIFSFLILLLSFLGCTPKDYGSSIDKQLPFPVSAFGPMGESKNLIRLNFKIKKIDSLKSVITVYILIPQTKTVSLLNYKWKFSPDIRLVDGQQMGSISVPKDQTELTQSIEVENFYSESLKHIRFETTGLSDKSPIHGEGILSNNPKDSFENIVKEVENFNAEK